VRARKKKPDEWEKLVAAARGASAKAYAPYSELRIGAALEGEDGRVYVGCNVENSSFGLTICAERAAVMCAVAQGEQEFRRLAIYTTDGGPLSPCGACRQVLAEFCDGLPIVSVGRGGLRRKFELSELLPQAFGWPAGDTRPAGEASGQPET
jgi:cytidine deaminase